MYVSGNKEDLSFEFLRGLGKDAMMGLVFLLSEKNYCGVFLSKDSIDVFIFES